MPKNCPSCDTEIGDTEKGCPACGVDFEELENAVAVVEKANSIIEKRKKKSEPAPVPVVEQKKKSVFTSLGNALRKK